MNRNQLTFGKTFLKMGNLVMPKHGVGPGNDGDGEGFRHFESSVAALRKTSDTVDSGRRQMSCASSALQSRLFTWPERTAPETFMRAGIGTSNGYPAIRDITACGQRSSVFKARYRPYGSILWHSSLRECRIGVNR